MAAKEEAAAEAPAAAPKGSKMPKGPLLIALINTLAVLGAMGMFVYTRMIYKRPQITESAERQKIEDGAKMPKLASIPGVIHFDPITVNIKPTEGKTHYAAMA